MSGYTQLTRVERYQIYVLKKAGLSQTTIAENSASIYRKVSNGP
jgi:IS30 family transposase